MEKRVRIKAFDGKFIYGALNYRPPLPPKLVIFAHGLTGHMNEHLFFNAAKIFSAKGFAVFRFNFYGGEKDARKFRASTVALHAKDLDAVDRHFRNAFRSISAVGHSLGGPSILLADTTAFRAIVLWDPSYDLGKCLSGWCRRHPRGGFHYIADWEVPIMLGEKMYREFTRFYDCGRLIAGIHVPVRIISAAKGDTDDRGSRYFRRANPPKSLVTIPGASHCFDEEGAEARVFAETLAWIKKFS